MRASTARLMNSPVRLADLTFPQVNRLIHRTRLAFVHLDNLLAFAKRDRDGRIDGYITAYLPEECLLLFFRKGEAVNAASLHTGGRQVITITEALKRMRAEVERGELAYCAAPMAQLAWLYQSRAAPRAEGERRDPGRAPGERLAVGAARGRDARCRRAAGGARERADRLVAAAARRRGSHDAGDRPQDLARGDAGAPLRAAIGRLLRPAAVAGVVVTWPAPCTSSPRRSATSTTCRRARPPR